MAIRLARNADAGATADAAAIWAILPAAGKAAFRNDVLNLESIIKRERNFIAMDDPLTSLCWLSPYASNTVEATLYPVTMTGKLFAQLLLRAWNAASSAGVMAFNGSVVGLTNRAQTVTFVVNNLGGVLVSTTGTQRLLRIDDPIGKLQTYIASQP